MRHILYRGSLAPGEGVTGPKAPGRKAGTEREVDVERCQVFRVKDSDGHYEVVAVTPDTDPVTGQKKAGS